MWRLHHVTHQDSDLRHSAHEGPDLHRFTQLEPKLHTCAACVCFNLWACWFADLNEGEVGGVSEGWWSCAAQSSSLEHLAVASLGAHSLKLPTGFPTGSSVIPLSWKIGHNHLRREFQGTLVCFWSLRGVWVAELFATRPQTTDSIISYLIFISQTRLKLWTTVHSWWYSAVFLFAHPASRHH